MLPGGYSSVLSAKDREELRDEIIRFAQRLGFDTVAAVTVVDRGAAGTEFISIDNTPEEFTSTFRDAMLMRRDPVMQHCRKQSVPIIWDQQTYVGHGVGELWEEQAQYGYRTGIAMALHLPEGRHFVLGVDRDQPLPGDAGELQRLVADLQLFAVHAQEAAVRLLLPEPLQPERPALWEVGAILGISERTAVLHVNNAMHKLGCASKHAAVLKALRLGLIH